MVGALRDLLAADMEEKLRFKCQELGLVNCANVRGREGLSELPLRKHERVDSGHSLRRRASALKAGFTPLADADRHVLCRRLYFEAQFQERPASGKDLLLDWRS